MIDEILKGAGIKYRATRFTSPPEGTYAVYLDDVTADGPDGYNRIFTHDITVELYAAKPDTQAEAAIERELNAHGLPWTKQARYWLQDVQRYQTAYDFSYIVKA